MVINGPPDFIYKVVWILLSILLILLIYYLVNIGNNYIPNKKRIRFNNKKVLPVLGIMILIYFTIIMFRKYSILSDTFSALILSMILAYIFNPIVDYLQKENKQTFRSMDCLFVNYSYVFDYGLFGNTQIGY